MLCWNWNYGIIYEDDFMLLYDINQSKNPEFPHKSYELFNFDALDPVECVADFRVEKQDIPRLADTLADTLADALADALGIPPVIKCTYIVPDFLCPTS